jgi:CRP-like cAMP-binding protein
MEDIKTFLGGVEEFKDLDDESLELLASSATVDEFSEDEIILSQGVKGEDVWLVLEGSVKVIQKKHDGKKVLLASLGPAQIFGEISVLTNNPTTAEVVAEKDCKAMRIPGEKLSELTKGDLTAMARFGKSVVYRLSDSARKR